MRVLGHVQGVYFRASLAERARSFGVDGWVRNLPDGSVEAVFEGTPRSVDALVEFCRRGPAAARVDELRVDTQPAAGERGFSIA